MSLPRSTEVFYITDAQFAVPTLISAESLRRWTDRVRINVVLLDVSDRQMEEFVRIGQDLRLDVHSLSTDILAAFGTDQFNATHVPHATLARFLISRFFHDMEGDVLYVDGDTLFVGDPAELLAIPAPERGLLAAEDQSYFYADEVGGTGRNVRAYFSGIGVTAEQGYFNAGVLKFRASEWVRISKECLAFLERNLAICQYHDQSALNAVVGKERVRLSPVWNFAHFYRDWGVSGKLEPKIVHFVGGDKPWMGRLNVWSDMYSSYMSAVERRLQGSFSLKKWNEREQADRLKAERWRMLKNHSIFAIRRAYRREKFSRLLKTSAV